MQRFPVQLNKDKAAGILKYGSHDLILYTSEEITQVRNT